jgi:hypothetical protein
LNYNKLTQLFNSLPVDTARMKSYRISIGASKSRPIIIIYYNNLRHRYWNGKVIGVDLKSEDNPKLLKAAFELKLRDGWRPQKKKTKTYTVKGKR